MRYRPRSEDFESFLDALNDAATQIPAPVTADAPPSAQITGLPRSGTTILLQLLARTGRVGYPSNVMAFFHRAPWVGARLQAQLALAGPTLSMSSLGGRTREPLDPHEFGYFWRRVCGHSSNSLERDLEPPPYSDVQAELDAVAAVFEAPVVYKNFLALAHTDEMRAGLDRMRFLVVERNLVDVAASLLSLRAQIGAGPDDAIGVQTGSRGISPGTLVDRVARQVVDLDRRQRACGFSGADDTLVVSYDALSANPRAEVGRALAFLGADGEGLDALPAELPRGRGRSSLNAQDRGDLEFALARAYDDGGTDA